MANISVEDFFESRDFDIVSVEDVAEVRGTCYTVKHKPSGANLLYIQNGDVNKSFSISFKTPPVDSTGVFHILEHSVLCGSKEYPVKEPFVNLLKSSMQTFLNAMTFPDKTVYPVSSTNSHDLENLMRIYLDAVFNPRIYTTPEIFKQEGWHKEVSPDGALEYNGVVYSEMKGALSDCDQIAYYELCKRLFPGTCYEYESGGLPSCIPNLTYDMFLETHKAHYNPSNCYVVLYGDLDIEHFVDIILNDFITPATKIDRGTSVPNEIGTLSGVIKDSGVVYSDIDASAQTCALGFVLDENTSSKDIFSLNAIFTYLMASNDSPLKQRLLETGLADDFYVSVLDSMKFSAVLLVAKGIKSADVANDICNTFVNSLKEIAGKGIDKLGVKAALNNLVYQYREGNFGLSDGVYYAIRALDSWLYDESNSTEYIKYEEIFSEIFEKAESDYFDSILLKGVVENDNHTSICVMAGKDKTVDTSSDVALSESEIDKITKDVEKLQNFQSASDDPVDAAKLPKLSLSDVENNKCHLKYNISNADDITYITHDLDISGIDYFNIYFDIKNLDVGDIPYLSVLTSLLTQFDTSMLKAQDIPTFLLDTVGSLNFAIDITDHIYDNIFEAKFLVRLSCLSDKSEDAFKFLESALHTSDFSDADKLKSLIVQTKLMLDQDIINSGHTYAAMRASSHLRDSSYISELSGGISYLQFLNNAISNIDEFVQVLPAKLNAVLKKVLHIDNLIFSTNVEERKAKHLFDLLGVTESNIRNNLVVSDLTPVNEGFIINSNVSFSALRADARTCISDFKPSSVWTIAQRILGFDYLWNNIRVQGGAYGCGFRAVSSGIMGFHTYRDPNVDSSFSIMRKTSDYLRNLDLSKEELEGYIISAIGAHDAPMKAKATMRKSDILHLQGIDPVWLDERRAELLDIKLNDLRELSPKFNDIWENSCKCTIGGEELVKNAVTLSHISRL